MFDDSVVSTNSAPRARITIDATPLLLRSAGVKTYFFHWIEQLAREDLPFHLQLFPWLPEKVIGRLDHMGSHLPRLATAWRLALLVAGNRLVPPLLEAAMPKTDLLHASNQIRYPPRKTRLSATIHDFTCWLMPELHTAANVAADRRFAETTLRRASRLIAVSESTRNDAARVAGLDESRIDVIYPGVSESYFDARRGGAIAERPYVLYAGTIEPRKNVSGLLDAWQALPESLREEFELLIAGPAGWHSEAVMNRLERSEKGVRYLGYVAEAGMPSLFAGATAFVYPSLYEGFGFPVAQAMACGTPVVTSGVSSLPEVTGEAGRLVDPRSHTELRDALRDVLTSPSLRARLGSSGRARAQQLFRWRENAQRSREFLLRAASE
jgi:alpha-1,3-rhamnosyl/mannosyltransferase